MGIHFLIFLYYYDILLSIFYFICFSFISLIFLIMNNYILLFFYISSTVYLFYLFISIPIYDKIFSLPLVYFCSFIFFSIFFKARMSAQTLSSFQWLVYWSWQRRGIRHRWFLKGQTMVSSL